MGASEKDDSAPKDGTDIGNEKENIDRSETHVMTKRGLIFFREKKWYFKKII